MINLTIDGRNIEVPEGTTILQAAAKLNIDIPTLCYLKEINEIGDCRMCLVEVEGKRGFATSCIQKVEEGMVVHTKTPEVLEARKTMLDLILSNHYQDCDNCVRKENCELQDLIKQFDKEKTVYEGTKNTYEIDDKSPSIVRDPNKCILCRRCVSMCNKVQKIGAIGVTERGFNSCVSTAGHNSLNDVNCTFCGQCIEVCPTGALREKDSTQIVWDKINDKNTYVIVQTAPSVRVSLGEEFGMPIGTNVEGKMVNALKQMGFDKVFDTNTGADFTIVEEGTEFIKRLQNNDNLPMITSCCPGWVKYIEMNYPENIGHLSSCKSPHEMFGALLKTYYAKKEGLDPNKIFVVSVMPCIAKKYERQREEMKQDVDAVITTRELARMIKQAEIDFVNLEDAKFDDPMGEATGAAAIFGVTGGVMEAALRSVSEIVSGKPLDKIAFEQVRGENGIKRAEIEIADKKVKVVVAHGLANAQIIMEEIKSGKSDYQFVEIMACPGGCITGGGQPIKSAKIQEEVDVHKKRAEAMYSIDEKSVIRKSHKNPVLKQIYKDFLGEPNGELAHKLLHTHYSKKDKYRFVK